MFQAGQYGSTAIFIATLAMSLIGLYAQPIIISKSLFRPYWVLRRRDWSTLFLSGFVHADLGHLLFNMITFYFFAFPLEARIGTGLFLVLYALALVLSSVYTWWQHNNEPEYATLGASGAIAAVLFAFIVYEPLSSLLIFPIPAPIPAILFGPLYIGYTYWAAKQNRGRINHDAHLWGAITGLLFILIIDPGAYGDLIGRFT